MKMLLSLLILISAPAYAQDHLNDEFIDCFTSAQNTKMTKYKIQPLGQYDAKLIYPAEINMVVEQFEEQSEDDPDFFNSGSCLTTEDGTTLNLCGSSNTPKNDLIAVSARSSQGSKVVYCEENISTYVYGVPTRPSNWRRQGPRD